MEREDECAQFGDLAAVLVLAPPAQIHIVDKSAVKIETESVFIALDLDMTLFAGTDIVTEIIEFVITALTKSSCNWI